MLEFLEEVQGIPHRDAQTKREQGRVTKFDGGWKAHARQRPDAGTMFRDGYIITYGDKNSFEDVQLVQTRRGENLYGRVVKHPAPQLQAISASGGVAEVLFNHDIVRRAAAFTTRLLQTSNPQLYAAMQRNARRYRFPLRCNSIWTSMRIAVMEQGAQVPRHIDQHNMPGTVGADLILSFGSSGGDLVLHYPEGGEQHVPADHCVLADFLVPHEVLEVGGSGERLAFIFWQQAAIVRYERLQKQDGLVHNDFMAA